VLTACYGSCYGSHLKNTQCLCGPLRVYGPRPLEGTPAMFPPSSFIFPPFHDTAPGAVMHFRAMLIFPRMKRNDFIASSKPSKRLGVTVHFDHSRQRQKEILFVNYGALSRLTNSSAFGFRNSPLVIFHFPFFISLPSSPLNSVFHLRRSRLEVRCSMFNVFLVPRPSSLDSGHRPFVLGHLPSVTLLPNPSSA
jgi:hypothetical protein